MPGKLPLNGLVEVVTAAVGEEGPAEREAPPAEVVTVLLNRLRGDRVAAAAAAAARAAATLLLAAAPAFLKLPLRPALLPAGLGLDTASSISSTCCLTLEGAGFRAFANAGAVAMAAAAATGMATAAAVAAAAAAEGRSLPTLSLDLSIRPDPEPLVRAGSGTTAMDGRVYVGVSGEEVMSADPSTPLPMSPCGLPMLLRIGDFMLLLVPEGAFLSARDGKAGSGLGLGLGTPEEGLGPGLGVGTAAGEVGTEEPPSPPDAFEEAMLSCLRRAEVLRAEGDFRNARISSSPEAAAASAAAFAAFFLAFTSVLVSPAASASTAAACAAALAAFLRAFISS